MHNFLKFSGVGGKASECIRDRSQRSANGVEIIRKLTSLAFYPKVKIPSFPT